MFKKCLVFFCLQQMADVNQVKEFETIKFTDKTYWKYHFLSIKIKDYFQSIH